MVTHRSCIPQNHYIRMHNYSDHRDLVMRKYYFHPQHRGTHSTSAPVITAESCSSWLQLSPSCQSLDNSGHIIGLYWQNVIIFHQPRRCWCRGCESLQCWLLCCVLLMMMIFKLSDISAQVSRVWAPSPVSRVTRPENWQLGLQLTAGQRNGRTSQTW